jgi:hypothetical protein
MHFSLNDPLWPFNFKQAMTATQRIAASSVVVFDAISQAKVVIRVAMHLNSAYHSAKN